LIATVMCATAILTELNECGLTGLPAALKHRCRANMMRRRGLIHQHSTTQATADNAWRAKHLICRQVQ